MTRREWHRLCALAGKLGTFRWGNRRLGLISVRQHGVTKVVRV
jgi:hypothetical protein